MGVSRWGGPSRRTRGIPPALFSMATRPIRQPPATKTDLPCVPRLIFLLSASAFSSSLLFPPRPPAPPPPPPSPSRALQPFFVSPLLLSRSFSPGLVYIYAFTRTYTTRTIDEARTKEAAKPRSCRSSFPLLLLLLLLGRSSVYFLPVHTTRVYTYLVARTQSEATGGVVDAKQRNRGKTGSPIDFADDRYNPVGTFN